MKLYTTTTTFFPSKTTTTFLLFPSTTTTTTTTTTTFLLFPPPPPPPPHFYCFLHHHHISVVFTPPIVFPQTGQFGQPQAKIAKDVKKRLVSLKETCLVLLRVIISRVFQLILFNFFFSILFCVLIIISEGCSLGMAVGPILMKFWACSLAWLTD